MYARDTLCGHRRLRCGIGGRQPRVTLDPYHGSGILGLDPGLPSWIHSWDDAPDDESQRHDIHLRRRCPRYGRFGHAWTCTSPPTECRCCDSWSIDGADLDPDHGSGTPDRHLDLGSQIDRWDLTTVDESQQHDISGWRHAPRYGRFGHAWTCTSPPTECRCCDSWS